MFFCLIIQKPGPVTISDERQVEACAGDEICTSLSHVYNQKNSGDISQEIDLRLWKTAIQTLRGPSPFAADFHGPSLPPHAISHPVSHRKQSPRQEDSHREHCGQCQVFLSGEGSYTHPCNMLQQAEGKWHPLIS